MHCELKKVRYDLIFNLGKQYIICLQRDVRAHKSVRLRNRTRIVSNMSNSKDLYPRSQTPAPRGSQNESSTSSSSARGRDRLTINFLAHGAAQSPGGIPTHMQQYSRTRTTSVIDTAELRRATNRTNTNNANLAVNNPPFDPRGR